MDELRDLMAYIEASPSPYHCVAESARRLREAGFEELDEKAAFPPLPVGANRFVIRGGSLVAFRCGQRSAVEAGFVLLGAHTDSPNLRVKPRPDLKGDGMRRWGVEVYGGVLLSTWLDRDLGLSGKVFVRGEGGAPEARLYRCDRGVARIPNLAIHLNRTVNSDGLKLNEQKHLSPLVGMESAEEFCSWLGREVDGEVLGWELGLHDLQKPAIGGMDDSFLYSARLDNQASCHAALRALLNADAAESTQVVALFDHEEVGSRSMSGAMGAFLRDLLTRLVAGDESEGGAARAFANSWLVSLDMAHAAHPNYADSHEPNHRPRLNGGPVIKEHVEQRYATSAESATRFRLACEAVDVPCQEFVIRTDLGCGSTIGPLTAAELGVATVDVGNAMLSMHSIREQTGAKDVASMIAVLERILSE